MKYLLLSSLFIFTLFACGGGSSSSNEGMLKTGYKYKIHKKTGNPVPNVGDNVEFDMDLFGGDGKLIQSMRGMPQVPKIQMPAADDTNPQLQNNPIVDLLGQMGEGDSASVYVPMDSIDQKSPEMAGLTEIYYTIVTRNIMDAEESKKAQAEANEKRRLAAEAGMKLEAEKMPMAQGILADYLAGKNIGKVIEVEGGLKVIILEQGTGDNAIAGNKVDVQYLGMLKDGQSFDNSFKRGTPFSFALGTGQVIKGWDLGIAQLNPGSKALLDIPSDLGYGAQGSGASIPPNSQLYFYVELEKIQ